MSENSTAEMKGLYGLTVLILLMCYPVAHCFFDPHMPAILNIVQGNQNYLVNLWNRQNSVTAENSVQIFNNGFSQLNTRLANIEAKADALKSQVESSGNTVGGTLAIIQNSIISLSSTYTSNVGTINKLLHKIDGQLSNIDQTLKRIENKTELNINETYFKAAIRTICVGISAENNTLQRQVSETDKLLKTYDQKLNTYSNTIGGVTNSLEEFKGILDRIETASNNNTFNDLTPMNEILLEIKNSLISTNESIHDVLSQSVPTSIRTYNDILQELSKVLLEPHPLSGNKSMMNPPPSKTDSTKASWLEIKELIKAQTQQFNETLNSSICKAQPSVIGDQITTLIAKVDNIESAVEYLSCDIIDIRTQVTTKNEFKNPMEVTSMSP